MINDNFSPAHSHYNRQHRSAHHPKMTITPFGLIFITLGLAILITRPAWLLPLLIVSAALQAFAVVIINPATLKVGLGITPWLFTCGLILIHLLVIILHNRRIELGESRPVKLLLWGWIIFIGWCVLSTFTLPFIFEGTPVHVLNDVFDNTLWHSPTYTLGFNGPMQPLVRNRISAILAANSIIIGMLFVYVLQLIKDYNIAKLLMSGFIAAVLVSFSISLYQRVELSGIVSIHLDTLYQSLNPSYHITDGGDRIGDYFRVNLPFSEPSYASVWYAGLSMGGVVMYMFANRSWSGTYFIVAGLSGLLISKGGSGLSGFALALLVAVTVLAVSLWRKVPQKNALWYLALVIVLIGVTAISHEVARQYLKEPGEEFYAFRSILQRRMSGSIAWRGQTNLDALAITRDTWGLGVGLGSNRASSYLFSMMSNIGVPGLALFLTLLTYQSYLIAFNSAIDIMPKALILGGTGGMLSGMIMGISDLMFPAWWIWLIAGFGLIASRQHLCPPQTE